MLYQNRLQVLFDIHKLVNTNRKQAENKCRARWLFALKQNQFTMKKITTLLFVCISTIVFGQVPGNGLIEHFTFNNTLINTTGTDTVNGSASFTADKCGGASNALSVVNPNTFPDAAIAGTPVGGSARSVSLWFKSLANNDHSLYNYGNSGACFGLTYSASGEVLVFGGATGSGILSAPLSYALASAGWTHVVVTYDGVAGTTLYINGVSAATDATLLFQTNVNNPQSRIGHSPYAGPSNFYDNFLLDELLIYNRALSAQEVSAIYNAQNGAPVITQQPSLASPIVCATNDEDAYISVSATGSGLSYQWTLNGNALSDNANDSVYMADKEIAGTYTYAVEVTGTCGTVTSNSVTLNVYSYPTPTIVQTGNLLQTQGYTTYQWQLNGVDIAGANGPNYTATQSGTYVVVVTNQDQVCEGVSPALNFVLSTGINDAPAANIDVYPNPAKGMLVISCDEQIESVTVYNLIGEQQIFEREQTTQLNVSALPKGIYTLQLQTKAGNKAVKKFVKE